MTKQRLKIFILIFAAILVTSFLCGNRARAAAGFPQIMTGQTTVNIGTTTYYGGLNGNFAVYNPDVNSTYGFGKDKLVSTSSSCQLYTGVTVGPICFFLGTGPDGTLNADSGSLMTGKTIIGDQVVYETPAMFFGGINVNGDVSGNFDCFEYDYEAGRCKVPITGQMKLWGKSLYQGSGSLHSGSSWNLGSNYQLNPDAQITWTSAKFAEYRKKILSLADSATKLDSAYGTFATGGDIYLQGSTLADSANSEAGKYPEGKVWVINDDPLELRGNIRYHGKGTIIVRTTHVRDESLYPFGTVDPNSKGNFWMKADKTLTAYDSSSRLGIMIVNNDPNESQFCDFMGQNVFQGMMLCDGDISTHGNVQMTGSFVAYNFAIEDRFSVRFAYDPTLDDNQPPGFRDLNLPTTTETGNR